MAKKKAGKKKVVSSMKGERRKNHGSTAVSIKAGVSNATRKLLKATGGGDYDIGGLGDLSTSERARLKRAARLGKTIWDTPSEKRSDKAKADKRTTEEVYKIKSERRKADRAAKKAAQKKAPQKKAAAAASKRARTAPRPSARKKKAK